MRVQIAGLSVNEALAQMSFSTKVRSSVVRHCLLRAINRADFYHGLTADALKVAEAFTGKGLTAPRIRHHGRGTMCLALVFCARLPLVSCHWPPPSLVLSEPALRCAAWAGMCFSGAPELSWAVVA